MKNYLCTDIAATLMFLAVVLVGGYFYLQEQVIEQNKQRPVVVKQAKLENKSEKTMFEVAVKRTE